MLDKKDFDFIREFWSNEFYEYTPKKLSSYSLNNDTISFLLEVGLMNGNKFRHCCTIEFLENFKIENDNYIKIGKSYAGNLYLDEDKNNVYFFEENILENAFCNSSLFKFVLFVTIQSQITDSYENVHDEALVAYNCSREIIEKFKKIDPEAIYPYSYWAVIMYNYAINYFYDEDDKFEDVMQKGKYKDYEEAYFDVLFNGFDVLK